MGFWALYKTSLFQFFCSAVKNLFWEVSNYETVHVTYKTNLVLNFSQELRVSIKGARTGSFQLLGDVLTRFSDHCTNTVTQTSAVQKSEIQANYSTLFCLKLYKNNLSDEPLSLIIWIYLSYVVLLKCALQTLSLKAH